MTAYRELIERLEERAAIADDWSEKLRAKGLESLAAKEASDFHLLRDAIRALEAQSKDKEEGE